MIDIEASIAELRAVWGTGPGMHKRPADLARYDVLIERVKPTVIVETGLMFGGSQIHFAARVPHVINVELNAVTTADYRNNRHGLGYPPANGHTILGGSVQVFDEVRELTEKLAEGGPVMVVLDSNHDTNTVYTEMLAYRALVTPGSYMVVEDGILAYLPQIGAVTFEGPDTPNNWFDGSPAEAIARYLSEYDDFENDVEIEEMSAVTMSPGGWLRRK